jgi:hypothetical protein
MPIAENIEARAGVAPAREPIKVEQLEKALKTTRAWLDDAVSPYAVEAHRRSAPAERNVA